jgi:membrane protein DedA with SNARE-associated domain
MMLPSTEIVSSLGYLGIFLLILLFPVPPEIVLPFAGFLSAQGRLNLAGIVISGVMGSTIASLPWYLAGRYLGEERLTAWVARHKWIDLSINELQRANRWFRRSGNQAVLLSQCFPIVRTLIAIPAGISRMNLGLFLLYLVASGIVWQGALAGAGYLLGSRYQLVRQHTSFLRFGAILLLAIAIIWYVGHRRRKKFSNATRKSKVRSQK